MFTNDVKRCAYYLAESANVKSRWACYFPLEKLEEMYDKVKSVPNNKEDCEVYILGLHIKLYRTGFVEIMKMKQRKKENKTSAELFLYPPPPPAL